MDPLWDSQALSEGGEGPAFHPSDRNSSSYQLFFGLCDPPQFCGPALWFTKIFIREINEPYHPGAVLVIGKT